jgi:hypothetical protein
MKLKRGTIGEDGRVYLRKKKGQEIWGTKEDFERMEKWRMQYMEKRRAFYRALPEDKKYKIGQQNPETGLYFIRTSGNLNPIWGTKENLDEYRKKRKQLRLSYIQKIKPLKIERMNNLQNRWRRGDIDPILGLLFFKYNSQTGNEIWMTKEKFNMALAKEKANRSSIHKKTN